MFSDAGKQVGHRRDPDAVDRTNRVTDEEVRGVAGDEDLGLVADRGGPVDGEVKGYRRFGCVGRTGCHEVEDSHGSSHFVQ